MAAAELRLKFRTGGVEADQYPQHMTVARWITAALDRETPFKCTAGLHHALPYADEEHGAWHQGFLNVVDGQIDERLGHVDGRARVVGPDHAARKHQRHGDVRGRAHQSSA